MTQRQLALGCAEVSIGGTIGVVGSRILADVRGHSLPSHYLTANVTMEPVTD